VRRAVSTPVAAPPARLGRRVKRMLQAQLRDMRVLARESRASLILFAGVLLVGSLSFHFLYTYPDTGQHPSLALSLYATLALVFFETVLPFSQHSLLQALFFLVPIIGLASLADGVVHFGSALVNKKERGQKWQVAMASTHSGHVIVCGLGKLGYRVVLELRKYDRDVVCVEQNAQGRFVEEVQAMGTPVIIADARRAENLVKAGVKRADSIMPCTSDELANLDIALDARELNPGIKVVMRMFDHELAQRVEKGFGIHTAFSTSALAAPLFAAAAMRTGAQHAFYVDGVLLNLKELSVQPRLSGRSIDCLQKELGVMVVFHEGPEGKSFHPDPDLLLQAGDTVTVIATAEELRRLNEANRTKRGKG
jgi:voltage-gated potassium channel